MRIITLLLLMSGMALSCNGAADTFNLAQGENLPLGIEQGVSDLVDHFSMSQPTISHHLNILKSLGLVGRRKEGKRVYYRINQENVIECCGMLIAKFGCDPEATIQMECE